VALSTLRQEVGAAMSLLVIDLWRRGGPEPLCPRCGCCSWEDVDGDHMLCMGRCDEGGLHESDRGDGDWDYGTYDPNPWPVCPACLDFAHFGTVCPELTRGLA
jgi:hypothetical protein